MPKANPGYGKSSLPPGPSRDRSPGRIAKNSSTVSQSKPAAIMSTPVDIVDTTKLHPNYRPRSPIQTRGKAKTGQQKQSVTGESSTSNSTEVPLSNMFDVLISDDENDNQGEGNDLGNDSSQQAKKVDNRKQPPIVVLDQAGAVVDNLLYRAQCEYTIKILKTSVRVHTLNRPMFEKVQATLKEGNINYYTFDSPDKVPVKIVLTGYIPVGIEGVKEVLSAHGVNPRDIKQLSKTETITGEHVLYLLYFERGSIKIHDLRKIKSLDGFEVSWRFFTKRPTDAAQCHRCQLFGHGSRGCSLPPKCVKCSEMHLTDACTLPRKENLGLDNAELHKPRVKCANCQGNHTANFRGCPARKVPRSFGEEEETRKSISAVQLN